MAKTGVTFANRWVRLALLTAAVAAAFSGARLITLAALFAGLAWWGWRRWRRDGKKDVAAALAAATVLTFAVYAFSAVEIWNRRAWRAEHYDDLVRLTRDGTYEGEGTGKRGPVDVRLTVKNGRIAALEVTRHHDTLSIAGRAIEEMQRRVVGGQTLDVDAISGATSTSNGVINAARDAAWKGVAEAPRLSFVTKIALWLFNVRVQTPTFHSLAVIFIAVLLLDYTLQSALVEGTGQTLNCMDCQTCVGTCPVKTAEGRLFPMEMVLRARLGDYETVMALAKYCVGCARCTAKCPAGISAPSVAAAVASYLRKQKQTEGASFFEKRA